MIDWRGLFEVMIAIFIMLIGAWIGYSASAVGIILLTLGCFVIDAVTYAVAMVVDETRYHVHMITAMMVTGAFLGSMWITSIITGFIGLF